MGKITNGKTKKSSEKVLAFVDVKNDSSTGFEQIDQSTMAIPFIKIIQLLSPELNKNKQEYIPGLKPGDFFNTVTKENYGNQIKLIIIKFEHLYTEWLPDRGGLVAYHDAKSVSDIAADTSKFGAWKTENGNDLSENYVYYVIIVGHENDGVAIVSMKSSNITVGKKLNRLLVTHVMENGLRALPYYLIWTFKTVYTENDQGNWFKINTEFDTYINEMQYKLTHKERKNLPGKTVNLLDSNDATTDINENTPY